MEYIVMTIALLIAIGWANGVMILSSHVSHEDAEEIEHEDDIRLRRDYREKDLVYLGDGKQISKSSLWIGGHI